MKFTNFQHKLVSLIVLVTFVALLHVWTTPAPAATSAGNSETTIAQGDNNGPSFVEEESSSEPVYRKSKKFPWLFVGLGVVVVGVAVYFLVIKKPKYTLTVTLGAGVTGTPAATAKYTKDTVVTYNYTAGAGYYVKVKLDGVDVAASGSVTMDKDKALVVEAKPFSILGTWSIVVTFITPGYTGYTSIFTFSGSNESGTFAENDNGKMYYGTYKVTNMVNVWFKYNTYLDTYVGTLTAENKMNGTFAAGSYYNGTWAGTKTSATVSTFAIPQVIPPSAIQGPKHNR